MSISENKIQSNYIDNERGDVMSYNSELKANNDDLKDILIQDYKFKIYTDSSNGNLGVIRIDYVLIPLNEIREIRNRVEITDQF